MNIRLRTFLSQIWVRIKNVSFRPTTGPFFTPTDGFTGFHLERAPMVLELQRANVYWSSDGDGDGKWRSIGETESSTGAVGALPFLMGGAVKLANQWQEACPS